jgi:hypothetical protein
MVQHHSKGQSSQRAGIQLCKIVLQQSVQDFQEICIYIQYANGGDEFRKETT